MPKPGKATHAVSLTHAVILGSAGTGNWTKSARGLGWDWLKAAGLNHERRDWLNAARGKVGRRAWQHAVMGRP